MITLDDVLAARERIRGGIYESPCVESIPLLQLTGTRIWCKLDYLQRTGSFKERGARNALLRLTAEQRSRGVVAAYAGNHALGVAHHGSLLGVPATVVMPRFAPLIKDTNYALEKPLAKGIEGECRLNPPDAKNGFPVVKTEGWCSKFETPYGVSMKVISGRTQRANLAKGKVAKVMHEWKEGELHSGSKSGPKVTSQKQAVAIALSEARRSRRRK